MSRKRRNQQKCPGGYTYWQTAKANEYTYLMFYNQMMELAISRFEWVNLPPTCDARWLELTLLTEGAATIAHPKNGKNEGFLYSTQAVTNGAPNIYQNPTSWRSSGVNGWNFQCDWSNGVMVYDNMMRFPLMMGIDVWAHEAADIMTAKRVNRQHMKIPFILKGGQEQQNDMLNLYKQVSGGEPAILVDKAGYAGVDVEAIDTRVDFMGDKLNEDLLNTFNEFYRLLGISSLPFKTERQVEEEIDSLNQPSEIAAQSPLKCRREACRKLNERMADYLPNGEISVVWAKDFVSKAYNFKRDIEKQTAFRMGVNDVE